MHYAVGTSYQSLIRLYTLPGRDMGYPIVEILTFHLIPNSSRYSMGMKFCYRISDYEHTNGSTIVLVYSSTSI